MGLLPDIQSVNAAPQSGAISMLIMMYPCFIRLWWRRIK